MVGTDALWLRSPDRRGRYPHQRDRPVNSDHGTNLKRGGCPHLRRAEDNRGRSPRIYANLMCKTSKKCWTLRFAGYNSYMLDKIRNDSLYRDHDHADPRP